MLLMLSILTIWLTITNRLCITKVVELAWERSAKINNNKKNYEMLLS